MPAQVLDPQAVDAEASQAQQQLLAQQKQREAMPDSALFDSALKQSDEEFSAGRNQLLDEALKQSEEESKPQLQRIQERIQSVENIPVSLAGRAITNVLGMPAAGAQAGAALESLAEAPNLKGLSVDQVKAVRAQMQQRAEGASKLVDQMMSGAATRPDDPRFYSAVTRLNSLEARIKEADNIIASGTPSTAVSPMISPVGGFLREFGKRASAPAMQAQLEQIFPTPESFRSSWLGQTANTGVYIATAMGLGAIGPLASTGFMTSQMGEQVYQAKKDQGASDEEAERASALVSLASASTMAVAGPTVDYLAKSFSGMTAKQGIQAIMRAEIPTWGRRLIRGGVSAAGTAAEFAGLDLEQQAIGRLQGYDPNRPLDHINWQNVFLGAGFGALHGIIAEDPRLAREVKPDIQTRNRPPPPAAPTAQALPPAAPPLAPAAAAPTAPAPAVVVTAKADPVAEFNRFADETSRGVVTMPGERGFELGPGEAPVPGVTRRVVEPTLALGAPPTAPTVERITEAASRFPTTGNVYTGATHVEALDKANEAKEPIIGHIREEGFLTNTGRFVGRDEAYSIAKKAAQAKPEAVPGMLFAEQATLPRPAEVTVPSTETLERQGETTPAEKPLPPDLARRMEAIQARERAEKEKPVTWTRDAEGNLIPSQPSGDVETQKWLAAQQQKTEAPPTKEKITPAIVGDIGKGITENLRNMLWEKVQKGETTEAGAPSNLLITAAREKAAGRLNTRADFDALYDAYGRHLRGERPAPAAAPTDPIRAAYDRVRSRQLGSAVLISDLAKETGMPVSELQAHLIAREGQGQLMLEPGHYPSATEEQRAAAIPRTNALGMPEPALTVRFPQPTPGEIPPGLPDPKAVLESHVKSLYTTNADRAAALRRLRDDAAHTVLGTPEGLALSNQGTSEAAAELSRRIDQQALTDQGLGDPNKRVTGYTVSWQDHTYSEQDAARYKSQDFASKQAAQATVRDLKKGKNTDINIRVKTEPKEPPWYKEQGPAASRSQIPPREPVDRPVSQDDVKQEVQRAQADMGMHDTLVYYPTVEDLPDHVKNGLSPQERNSTAQIVIDNKLGTIGVIGDRFSTLNELRRAIIEEALPYRYRNVTKLDVKHDPTDRNFGTYDHISDNPQLNTHALLGAERPYEEAAKTAMEEVNVHQGISKLLGLRYGRNYINGMDSVQSQFDRLKLNDILAQKKGYANLEEMAKAYLEDRYKPNWRDDPASKHKMTEELIGAYSRTFGTPEELAANGPTWYQNALRGIQNGIRRHLGMEVSPYDVQSLLHDSAAALRRAKLGEPSDFHPVGDQAKQDMEAFRYANRPPEEGAPGAGEKVDISTELVRARIAELRRGLGPGQQLREQPLRLAMYGKGSLQERLNYLNDWPAIISHEAQAEVYAAVLDMFDENLGGDAEQAIQYIMDNDIPGARNAILADVVGGATRDKIDALRAAGESEQADILAARLDRMNAIRAQSVTEMARGLASQKLLTKNGSSEVGIHKTEINGIQEGRINDQPEDKAKVDKGMDDLQKVTQDAARKLQAKTDVAVAKIAKKIPPRGPSVPEQYLSDLVNRIQDAMFKTNAGFGEGDKPALQSVFDTFRQNIQQIVNERVMMPKPEKPPAPKATDTLRTIMDNYSYYKEAWARTMDMLYNQNPELAQRFDRAIEESVGEKLANKLTLEQGQNLRDLVYDHYSRTDRINTDLATKIVNQTGLSGDIARTTVQYLQNIFSDIIKDEQQQKLQSILDSVGGNAKAATRGELGHLVDHIVIGGLDSPEWLNLVAPRFGIDHYTPEDIETLRKGGDYMSYLRSNGLSNSPIAQQVRMQIGDIMRPSRVKGRAPSKFLDAIRYASDVYVSGLLTSLFTHAPYWQQALLFNMGTNTLTQVARAMAATKGEMNAEIVGGAAVRMLDGFARGVHEFLPIIRSGIKPPETFLPQMGEKAMYSTPLEKVTPRLGDVGSWFANYKYVRNTLDAVSNLMTRGSQYATAHAMEMKLAWDDGLSGQAAWDAAERIVLGSPEARARAANESHSIVADIQKQFPDHTVSEDYRKMLEGHLLDEYKTTSQNPDSVLANQETEDLRDLHRRAIAPAIRGALRNDVPGMWGMVSRGILDFSSEYPLTKLVSPFNKVPYNLIQELLSWGPLGVWRSAADLVPSDWGPVHSFAHWMPGMREGIRGYLEKSPILKAQIKSGEISKDYMRDLAWEQMVKGVIGSSATAALGIYSYLNRNNPDAPIRFTHAGPANYQQQQTERAKGWQPQSVYFGGAWHSYENTPFRAMFSTIGAMEDAFRYDKEPPNLDMVAFRSIAGGLSSVFGSPLQGPELSMQLLTGMSQEGALQRKTSDFLAQVIGAMVATPFGGTMTRHLLRLGPATEHPAVPGLFDPTQYYPVDRNDTIGKMTRYIPVVNAWTGQPKLNVLGEHMFSTPLHNIPEYTPTGGLFGIGPIVKTDDPVWNYLAEHPGIHLSMPGATGWTARIKNTPQEQYEFQLARGPILKGLLAKAFEDPHFNELPEPTQNRIIKVYERAATRMGEAAVMSYRKEHPVTGERIKQALSARGIAESEEFERRISGGLPTPQPESE